MIPFDPGMDDLVVGAVSFFMGGLFYRLGSRPEPEIWELDKRPSATGVEIWAKKGKKEMCLHRVAYDRSQARKDRDVPFDEKYAEALAQARSFLRSMNASERE